MVETAFFDTNLFLYAYSRAPEDREKRDLARDVFGRHQPVISAQVIQEFIAAALRKPALGLAEEKLDEFLAVCACHDFSRSRSTPCGMPRRCAAASRSLIGTAPSSRQPMPPAARRSSPKTCSTASPSTTSASSIPSS